ncbi:MAG: hypothetical protein LBH86_06265, partial [Oscillospiraceae bacterium]|nr:hypothetical protein [Oscillospiraceae bacterium]
MISRLSGIFEGRGLSTPVIALTNVTGVPFAVMSGLQGGGSAAYEAAQLGKDPLTQLAYGTAEGVLTGGIEALSGLGASAALKSTVGKALAKVAPKAAAWLTRVGESVAGKLFLSGAGEGWEEFIQYPGDKLLARIFLNDESPYDVKEQAYGALMASILGALMSAPGAVSESGMAKQERDNIAAAARAANEFADTTYQSLKLTPPTRLDPARATAEDVEKHFRDIQKVVTAQAEVERQQTNEAMRRAGLNPELARLTENMTPVQTQPSGTTTPPAASSVPADILPLTQSIKSGLVPDARSAQLPSETARLLDTVGRRIGVRVVIGAPEASMGANGWYGNGQLVIAQDAANPLVVVLKHEVTHRMQEAAPEEYNLFRNYAARQMALRRFGGRLDAGISNYQQRYAQKGRTLTQEGALDEMAADYTEYLMTNPGDFEAVAQDNRTLARRLFESLRQVLRNIKAAFTGNTARNRAALEQTGRSYTQLQEGLTLWENALRAT